MMRLLLRGLGLLCVGFALLLLAAGIVNRHLPRAAASAPVPVPAHTAALAVPPATSQPSFADLVLRRVGRRSSKRSEIRFDPDNSAKSIALTLVYRRTPSGYAEVEADTGRVARAVPATLLAEGRNPHTEWVFVSVRAQQPAGQGETGIDLTPSFGSTHYDFNSDQLVFEPR
jgi:hypothetical protein